jgi:hypothetical protein
MQHPRSRCLRRVDLLNVPHVVEYVETCTLVRPSRALNNLHWRALIAAATSAAVEDVFGAMPSYNMMTPMQRNNE